MSVVDRPPFSYSTSCKSSSSLSCCCAWGDCCGDTGGDARLSSSPSVSSASSSSFCCSGCSRLFRFDRTMHRTRTSVNMPCSYCSCSLERKLADTEVHYVGIIMPPSCREGPFQALFLVMAGFIRVLGTRLLSCIFPRAGGCKPLSGVRVFKRCRRRRQAAARA